MIIIKIIIIIIIINNRIQTKKTKKKKQKNIYIIMRAVCTGSSAHLLLFIYPPAHSRLQRHERSDMPTWVHKVLHFAKSTTAINRHPFFISTDIESWRLMGEDQSGDGGTVKH